MQKRNKFQRVQLPRRFGLNGENSVLIPSMIKLETSLFVRERKSFSVRTFWADGDETKPTPHLVTITKKALFKKAPEVFRVGLALIVADKIDPKDCLFRGCIAVDHNGVTRMEVADGPGTVRTVTHEGRIDFSKTYPLMCSLNCGIKHELCVWNCQRTLLRNIIFEFSYYCKPVGWKQEKFICWEITDDGTGKNRLFKEH